jgi:disulfide bond formation protein DsbB
MSIIKNAIMAISLRTQILVVFLVALSVIGTALASEIYGGLIPCALCLKQRMPYYLALPLLAVAFWYAPRGPLAARGLLATIGIIFLASAGLGIYHAGIEYGSWAGPATCGGGAAIASSPEKLFEALQHNSIVRCDAAAWSLFGISLAGYNALASLALATMALGLGPSTDA